MPLGAAHQASARRLEPVVTLLLMQLLPRTAGASGNSRAPCLPSSCSVATGEHTPALSGSPVVCAALPGGNGHVGGWTALHRVKGTRVLGEAAGKTSPVQGE